MRTISRVVKVLLVVLLLAGVTAPTLASFSGTDIFIPSVGQGTGMPGSEWYTCIWVYNPGVSPVNAQYFFLERNQPNPAPLMVLDVIPPGGTFRIDNIVQNLFGLTGKFGALRVVAAEKLLVSARIYSKVMGTEDKDSVGQFFAGVPANFAIGSGQSTQLLGVYQTTPQADSQFRYNFGFVEVTGNSVTVRVTARDFEGSDKGWKEYTLGGFEPRQYNITNLLPGVNSPNLRLDVQVISGPGKVIAFASSAANRSNDPSTFEMSFRDDLLGGAGGGLGAVSHDASLTGDGTSSSQLGIAATGVLNTHLANAAVTPAKISASGSSAGQVLTSDGTNANWQTPSSGGSGGGITSVVHDATLGGSGTAGSPLGIAGNAITTDKLADGSVGSAKIIDASIGPQDLAPAAVTQAKLSASGTVASGKVLGTDGTSLQWQSAGSGSGSLALPYFGSASTVASADAFHVQNAGSGRAIRATSQSDTALWAVSTSGQAVVGWSTSGDGVEGKTSTAGKSGVWGHSTAGAGVTGASDAVDGVVGVTTSTAPGAAGVHASNSGGSIAIYSDGDIYATGAFRGNIGSGGGAPFPRPAYDSGWVAFSGGYRTFTHSLGGNTDNYVVELTGRYSGLITNEGIGGDLDDGNKRGAYYWGLSATQVLVTRGSDNFYDSVRVRIWVYR